MLCKLTLAIRLPRFLRIVRKLLMKITTREQEHLREILVALTEGNQGWLEQHAIEVSQQDPFWILNYQQSPRTPYNQLTRGLVVERPSANFPQDPLDLIRSFPFTRFFNHGEIDAAQVEFSRAEMLEKLDGSMVGVFFPSGKVSDPYWQTRRAVASIEGARQPRLLARAGDYVRQLAFAKPHTEYTWVFEFVHSVSMVRTKYRPKDYGLYLLGVRHLLTHQELNEDQLDDAARQIGARRPRRWGVVTCRDEIQRILQAATIETPDFEGFVFRDRETGARIKLKDPNYVQALHLGGQINWRTLIPKVLEGEAEEIIAYIPSAQEKVFKIRQRYQQYLEHATIAAERWLSMSVDQKTLAAHLFAPDNKIDSFLRSQIMKLHSIETAVDIRGYLETAIRRLALGQGGSAGNPNRLTEILGLDDEIG